MLHQESIYNLRIASYLVRSDIIEHKQHSGFARKVRCLPVKCVSTYLLGYCHHLQFRYFCHLESPHKPHHDNSVETGVSGSGDLFEDLTTDFQPSHDDLSPKQGLYLPTSMTKPMEEQTLRINGMTNSRAGDGSWIRTIVRPVPTMVTPNTHFTCLCPKVVFQSKLEALAQKNISKATSCAICNSHDGLLGRNLNRCGGVRRHSVGSHVYVFRVSERNGLVARRCPIRGSSISSFSIHPLKSSWR